MAFRKFTAYLLLTVFAITLVLGQGCMRQNPTPLRKTTPTPSTSNVAVAQNIARIAKDVKGVKNSYVVVNGKVALIGLVVAPKLTDKEIASINKLVDKRVRAAHKRITRVAVTENPRLVARIKRMSDRIATGGTVTNFQNEFTSIFRAIHPAPAPLTKTTKTTTGSTADRVAKIAKGVKGVKNAYVTISGNTALIGLVVAPNLSNAEIGKIKTTVDKLVRGTEKGITRTVITENPDLVARIKAIGEKVAAGRPISGFADEIGKIIRRVAPVTKTTSPAA